MSLPLQVGLHYSPVSKATDLLVLTGLIRLRSEVSRGGAGAGEESSKNWLNDGSEHDLSPVGHWEGHPEDEDKLEDVVECC